MLSHPGEPRFARGEWVEPQHGFPASRERRILVIPTALPESLLAHLNDLEATETGSNDQVAVLVGDVIH